MELKRSLQSRLAWRNCDINQEQRKDKCCREIEDNGFSAFSRVPKPGQEKVAEELEKEVHRAQQDKENGAHHEAQFKDGPEVIRESAASKQDTIGIGEQSAEGILAQSTLFALLFHLLPRLALGDGAQKFSPARRPKVTGAPDSPT